MRTLCGMLVFLLIWVGCSSSQKKTESQVKSDIESQAYEDVNPSNQYSRALSMVEADQNLNETEKKNLTNLIEDYGKKVQKNRNLQSKYRALLVHEMLVTGDKKNSKVDAAKEGLMEIDEKNSKDLQKFIRDFKFYAGENARIHQPTLIEAIHL